jgi:hypothetical protein
MMTRSVSTLLDCGGGGYNILILPHTLLLLKLQVQSAPYLLRTPDWLEIPLNTSTVYYGRTEPAILILGVYLPV